MSEDEAQSVLGDASDRGAASVSRRATRAAARALGVSGVRVPKKKAGPGKPRVSDALAKAAATQKQRQK